MDPGQMCDRGCGKVLKGSKLGEVLFKPETERSCKETLIILWQKKGPLDDQQDFASARAPPGSQEFLKHISILCV